MRHWLSGVVSLLAVLVGPESRELFRGVVWDHGGLAWGPAGWADLTVLVGVLEGLNEAEGLLDVSADWEVGDRLMSEDTVAVDDVGSAEGDTLVIAAVDEAAVVLGDLLGDISEHWHLHVTETALSAWLHGVLSVGEVGVDGAANDLGADSLELSGSIAEGSNLSGADESEVEWPEEENDVLACGRSSKREEGG